MKYGKKISNINMKIPWILFEVSLISILVKILSIKVADLSLTRVGLFISGMNV